MKKNRLILWANQNIVFAWDKQPIKYQLVKHFKQYDRIIIHYENGHKIKMYYFKDGHREIEVK